jgi:menaquinone-dependent protoporphyrinogen oxidase
VRVLIVFGTSEGHTAKISAFLADRMRGQGHAVTLADASGRPPPPDPAAYDAVVVAARVHSGRYPRAIARYVRDKLTTLAGKRTAFVPVSMMAARAATLPRAERYTGRFLRLTGWRPSLVHQTAGARYYTRHGAIGRWILARLDGAAGFEVDTRRDYDWTDWDALGRFAEAFLAPGRPPGTASG